MPSVFSYSSTRRPTPLTMSQKKSPRIVVLGSVAKRPANEVRAELARACQQDRETISTPIPRPASGCPTKFVIVQRPPLPAPPPRYAPADPLPAISSAVRREEAARRMATIEEETEAAVAPLRRVAGVSAAPRPASPEREWDDHYDLAWWRRWSTRWSQ